MTETDETTTLPKRGGPPLWRIAIVVGSLVVLAATAALTLGASPSPSASTAPDASTDPTKPGDGWAGPGFAMRDHGAFGMHGGDITVTAVSGSNLSLKTDDGWTRTITVTSDTKITKGGQTVAVGEIKVGDTIVFQQSRQSDGNYTITAIEVVVPKVGGTVGEVTSSGFTLTDSDGVKWTVDVSSSTTYTVDGAAGTKADVKAGLDVVVQGTQSGTTIAATAVHVRQPHAAGQVTAKTSSTITIERGDGTSLTIKVDSATTYTVNGAAGSLADVTVGMALSATGSANSDGSFSATAVRAGDRGGFDHGFGDGFGRGHGHGMGDWPNDPTPSASPGASGSTG